MKSAFFVLIRANCLPAGSLCCQQAIGDSIYIGMDTSGTLSTHTVGEVNGKMEANIEIENEIREEVANNINKTDKLEIIKQYVISAINCRIGDVTNIEGIINVTHLGGETQLVFDGTSSAGSSSFDSSKENDTNIDLPAVSTDGKNGKDVSLTVDQHVPEQLIPEDLSKPSSDQPAEQEESQHASPVGFNEVEEIQSTSNDKRTFTEHLDEIIDEVVANYVAKVDHTREQPITNFFPVEKNKFPLRIDLTGKVKRPKVNKKHWAKRFLCNQCDAEFTALESLCDHTMDVHKTFRCMVCNQTFTQRSNLQRHSLKHIGFKPFVCGVCNKGYYRKDHLVRHIEVTHPETSTRNATKSLISSAKCLAFIAYCRKEGLDPSKCKDIDEFKEFFQYQNNGSDSDIKLQFDFFVSDGENSQPESVDNHNKVEDNSDNADIDMDVDANEDKASEEQYYEDENGDLVLIVEPEPVPW